MQVDIRQALVSDKEQIFQIKKAAFKNYIDQAIGWVEGDQLDLHEKRTNENRLKEIEILESSGTIVGYASTRIIDKSIQLFQLFIDPKFQGKGLGESYLKILFVRADALDCRINARILKNNDRALKFYLRYGFRIIKEAVHHYHIEKSDNFIIGLGDDYK